MPTSSKIEQLGTPSIWRGGRPPREGRREKELMSTYQRFFVLLGAAVAGLGSGCSGSKVLNAGAVKDAQSAIIAAEKVGAAQDTGAKQHLDLAQQQAAEAKRLADK